MLKSQINLPSSYFDTYIDQVPELSAQAALSVHGIPLIEKHRDRWTSMGELVYAPGKWNINDILQHVIDTERVFSYRALRIGRGDSTPMPGFDQEVFNNHIDANNRKIPDIIKELIALRQSTIWLFESMDEKALLREGSASELTMNPLALSFMITGHFIHHVNILEERYYPLLNK
ncbi:MAG: hypothetical protein ACI9FN_002910 [Saprospiraceae bacterium]|jgi:hypothetical protein